MIYPVDVLTILDRIAEYMDDNPRETVTYSGDVREVRAVIAEMIETLRLSAEAIDAASRCVGPDLAVVMQDRAMFARAALANVGAST